jgi:hypothetical protein
VDQHSLQLGYFGALPNEIILRIFHFLDYKTISTLCCVCKHFQLLADDERLWHGLCEDTFRPNLLRFFFRQKPAQLNSKWMLRSIRVSFFFLFLFVWFEPFFSISNTLHCLSSFFCFQFELPPNRPYNGPAAQLQRNQRYFGNWENGKRCGFGILLYDDVADHNSMEPGAYYSGNWVDDKRHGMGRRKWSNGNTYIGQYQDNKRHGDGMFVFANGSEFIGSFRHNKFTHGVYKW